MLEHTACQVLLSGLVGSHQISAFQTKLDELRITVLARTDTVEGAQSLQNIVLHGVNGFEV